MVKKIILLWIAWVMVGIVVLYAQNTGDLNGTIKNRKGEAIPFVSVF